MHCQWLRTLAFLFTFMYPSAAFGFMGTPDTENKFPFVVRVLSPNNLCTGTVVTRRLVITAAHCIWASGSYRNPVVVEFWDETEKRDRQVRARFLQIPEKYKQLAPQVAAISNIGEETTRLELVARQALYFAQTTRDIGVIITNENIWVSRYARTPFSTQQTFREILHGITKNMEWKRSELNQLTAFTRKHLDANAESFAIGVGYGTDTCIRQDWKRLCKKADLHRRWGYVKIGATQLAGAPLLQTTRGGTGWNEGKNPMLPGDSGGPLLLPHKTTDDWFFIGIVSTSSDIAAQHTLITNHLEFILNIVTSVEYQSALAERGALALAASLVNGYVSIGFKKAAYMEDAVRGALTQCIRGGGNQCAIVATVVQGCLYATIGSKQSLVKWQAGITTQDAYLRCTQNGFTCKPPIGGCLP